MDYNPRTAKHFHNSPVVPLRLAKVDDYYRIPTLTHKYCTLDFSHCYCLLYSHQKCDTRKYIVVSDTVLYKRLLCKHGKIMLIRLYMYMCWWWWYGCLVDFIPFYYCIWIILDLIWYGNKAKCFFFFRARRTHNTEWYGWFFVQYIDDGW